MRQLHTLQKMSSILISTTKFLAVTYARYRAGGYVGNIPDGHGLQ